jgi:hypothetical protein
MKKLIMCCLFLFTFQLFAQQYNIKLDNLQLFENRVTWSLTKLGESHTIQNVTGKTLRLDLWVDKFLVGSPNTLSDKVYIICGQKVQQIVGGSGIVCDIPYPGNATILVHPFTNGATGQFSLYY